jgi:hypothetical protein
MRLRRMPPGRRRSDPRRCNFDPARDVARCAAGQDGEGCLTKRQSRAIPAIYEGIRLPAGECYFHGFPRGSEGGWPDWIIAPPGKTSRQMSFGETFMRNMAFGRPLPDFDPARVDYARDLSRMGTSGPW